MTRGKSSVPADNAEVIRLTSDEINHKKLRVRHLHRFTILHYSPFKAVWDWFVLLLVVYTAIFTPYSAAFLLRDDQAKTILNRDAETRQAPGPDESYTDPLVIIDLIVDVMFIVDIFINFRTTFIDDSKGEVVSDPAKIAIHYLKGWFVIDVLAAIPFDLLMFGFATNETTTNIIGLLKTARLLRLLRVCRRIDHYSQYAPAVIILLMCAFALVAHWLACIWYWIGEAERPAITFGWLGTLSESTLHPYKNDSTGGPTLEARYITSLYFTLTVLTTVGFGNVAPNTDAEKLFAITIMMMGSLMFACIFGNMTAIIERLYEGMARYHQQMNLVKEFVKFHNVPPPLKIRLQEYFKHAWVYMNGNDMNEVAEVMKDFPDFLQADISLHLNRNLFRSSSAFAGVNQGCLRALSMKLQTTHTAPGDVLIHRGDKLSILYFISRGSLEILQGNVVLAILGKNDVVGENFCQRESIGRSKGTVRALTYCDLLTLSRTDLEKVCQLYPEFTEHFARRVEVTVDMRDTSESLDTPPGTPLLRENDRDPEDIIQGDGQNVPRKRRTGADLHTRVTLTPVPSKESVQRSGDDVSGKGKGNRNSPLVLMQMHIERGHMANENVLTSSFDNSEFHKRREANNRTIEEEDTDPGSDVPMILDKSFKKRQHRQTSRHVNFHPSNNFTHSTPELTSPPPIQAPSKPAWSKSRDSLQTSNRSLRIPSTDNSLSPSIIVEDVSDTMSQENVHKVIDGLYDQLDVIQRKFDEQKQAIIDFLLHPQENRNIGYMQTEWPISHSLFDVKPSHYRTDMISQRNIMECQFRNGDILVDLNSSPNGTESVVGDVTTTEDIELNLMQVHSNDAKSNSFPNIITDPDYTFPETTVPLQQYSQSETVYDSKTPIHSSALPPSNKKNKKSTSAGHVSTASWRMPNRENPKTASFSAINVHDPETIWLARKESGVHYDRLSSTDC